MEAEKHSWSDMRENYKVFYFSENFGIGGDVIWET